MQSSASHILGAEITYSHISEYKYNVFVTVYRDCNECKIAGGGGGSNTKDCGEFYLFLKSSNINGCTSKSLKQYSLTRQSISEILPLCPTVTSKCKGDSGLSYGVEAHTFSTEIDFENFKSFQNCGYEMYVQLATRADDIDNLSQSSLGETLYNFSYINPFEVHSSPVFTANPEILLTVNHAAKSFVTTANSNDSISIHFARPLRGSNNEIEYQDGYSLQRPLSVWCNGDDEKCEANPQANPPVGVTLDIKTGFLAYTPVKNYEKATLVFEVEQWRNTKDGMTLISKVRRDILVSVTSYGQQNNPPQLFGTSQDTKTNNVNVCVGEEICFDILAKDAPYIYPDGSYQSAGTVQYDWVSQLPGAVIKQVAIAQAPYNKLQVCWTPNKQDIGKSFALQVKATDNHCLLQASSTANYTVVVNGKPENNAKIKELWCGNIQLDADSLKSNNITSVEWNLIEDNESTYFTSTNFIDTIRFNRPIKGQLSIRLTTDEGCSSELDYPINKEFADLTEDFGSILGLPAYCIGDTVHLIAKTRAAVKLDQVYWLNNLDTFSKESMIQYPAIFKEKSDVFDVVILGSKGTLSCFDIVKTEIIIEQGHDVEFTPIAPVCEGQSIIDISESASVLGGTWKGIGHNCIEDNQINIGKLGDISSSTELCQEYTTTSPSSRCLSRDTLCVWVVANPVLNLEKRTVCGATGYFNLTNMDPAMYSFGEYDIDWTVDGKELASNALGNPHLLELTGLSVGEHVVVGVYRNEFGCSTRDTGILSLLENIDLSSVTSKQLCQGETADLNDIFGIDLGGGFWTSPSNAANVINNSINPEVCGTVDLIFTYDQFGCYVTHDVMLDVVCKPSVTFILKDTLCALEESVNLIAIPNNGRFEGDNIKDNVLEIDETSKTYDFKYLVNKAGCVFEFPQKMTVMPAPKMVIGSGMMAAICEGQSIELKPINVSDGILEIKSSQGTSSFTGKDNLFKYEPTTTEIEQRKAIISLALIGSGYCPIPVEEFSIKINAKAKIHLLYSQFEGCTPFSFKPNFSYDSEIVDWSMTQTEWDFGDAPKRLIKIQPSYNYKTAGTYSVSLHTVSPEGCVYNKTWLNAVTVHNSPDASFRPSPTGQVSVRQSLVSFTNTSSSVDSMSYFWNFGTGNANDVSREVSPSFTYANDTGTYSVCLTATTANGCEDKYIHQVIVGPDIRILVPNAFSPNDKGSKITEEFKVVGTSVSYFHIEIFNRWGQQVYKSDNIDEEWDGKSGGRFCEVGVYAYLIQATSMSGETYEFKGTIHLLR